MTQKEKIIRAATKLFVENSIKGVTMDMVALEVGMSKRTIYENFSDKRTLLTECVNFLLDYQDARDQEILSQSADVVEELFSIFEFMDKHFLMIGRFSVELRKFHPEIFARTFQSRQQTGVTKLRGRLERGMQQGIIKDDVNLDFAVTVIHESLYNIVFSPGGYTSTSVSMPEAFKYVLTYFFRGISTERGIRLIDDKLK